MNILTIVPNFYPENSGFANAFTHFALELAQHRKVNKVVIFTNADLGNANELIINKVEVVRSRRLSIPYIGRLPSFFLWTKTVELLIRERKIDVLFYETGTLAPFGLLVLRLIRKKYPTVKFILRVHSITDTERTFFSKGAKAKLHAYFTRKLYYACNIITATNGYHIDFVKKKFLRGDPFVIGKKIFFVIPNIVHVLQRGTQVLEQHQYREIFEQMRDKKVFFSLGGMSRGGMHGQGKFVQKGFLDLLYGVSLVEDKGCLKDALFLIVAQGKHQQYFKEEIRRLGLDKYFVVIDYLPNEIVHYIQQRAHATVLVSRVEGLSMFALEALANGSPLLVTRTGGLIDLVEEGRNGYFAEVQNIEDISKKITLFLSLSEEEIKKMRDRSGEIFRSKFSPKIIVERFVKFAELV